MRYAFQPEMLLGRRFRNITSLFWMVRRETLGRPVRIVRLDRLVAVGKLAMPMKPQIRDQKKYRCRE